MGQVIIWYSVSMLIINDIITADYSELITILPHFWWNGSCIVDYHEIIMRIICRINILDYSFCSNNYHCSLITNHRPYILQEDNPMNFVFICIRSPMLLNIASNNLSKAPIQMEKQGVSAEHPYRVFAPPPVTRTCPAICRPRWHVTVG